MSLLQERQYLSYLSIMFNFLFFLIAGASLGSCGVNLTEIDRLGERFVKEVTPYKENIGRWAARAFLDMPTIQADYLPCEICPITIRLLRSLIELGASDEEITNAVAKACSLFLLPDYVCKPTLQGYVETLSYMLKNNPMTTDDFCGTINENCGVVNATFTSWETVISGAKPSSVERPPLPVKKTLKTYIWIFERNL